MSKGRIVQPGPLVDLGFPCSFSYSTHANRPSRSILCFACLLACEFDVKVANLGHPNSRFLKSESVGYKELC
jgi:hypothetical protein